MTRLTKKIIKIRDLWAPRAKTTLETILIPGNPKAQSFLIRITSHYIPRLYIYRNIICFPLFGFIHRLFPQCLLQNEISTFSKLFSILYDRPFCILFQQTLERDSFFWHFHPKPWRSLLFRYWAFFVHSFLLHGEFFWELKLRWNESNFSKSKAVVIDKNKSNDSGYFLLVSEHYCYSFKFIDKSSEILTKNRNSEIFWI